MRNELPFPCPKAKGSALMLILIILGLATALLVSALKSNPQVERDKITADTLAKAKDALIGDTVSQLPVAFAGYLRLPDLGFGIGPVPAEGSSAPNFTGNAKDYSVIGKVPWKTLGIAPSRDDQGECLWYVVSGRFKKTPPTDSLNWDTQGQIDVIDGNGNVIASNVAALLIAPGKSLDGQNRALSDPVYTQCGGNYDAQNYFDAYNSSDAVSGEVNYFTGSTNKRVALNANNKRFVLAKNDHYNDRFLFVTADDIFNKVRQRSDFKTAVDTLVFDFVACLNGLPSLPAASAGNKGMDGALVSCPAPTDPTKANFYKNWKDNLLYAKPGGPITVNASTCDAVLIFGGARTGAQARITGTDKASAANYLEGANATSFPSGTSYTGAGAYAPASPSADVLACIGAPSPIVGGTPITLDATTIIAACSGVCGSSGINTAVTTLALAGTPALTVSATGGTIGRDQGGASTDAIGVYGGSGGAPDTALQSGESLSFRLTGNTAQKFGITLYGFGTGEQALLTFKNNGTLVGTYTATTAITANINPGGAFNEVIVQAIGASAFWVQTVKFCDAATSC